MLVSDFHFDLPEELIAQHPPAVRGASRMLVLDRASGAVTDGAFRDLPQWLRAGDLLILNDSRVLPARLFATRAGLATQANSPQPSGVIEVLLTEEVEPLVWRALVKPARKVRLGETLHFYGPDSGLRGEGPGLKPLAIEPDSRGLKPAATPGGVATPGDVTGISPKRSLDGAPNLTAEVVGAGEFGERTLRFAPVEDFYGTLGRIGHMPLPPYIHRDQAGEADSEEDRERYQTVYSQQVGSAAAPTAGLHFTPEVLAALEARGVEVRYLTLHVGLGTFQPVRVSELKDIRLHAERYTLPAETAEALNRALAEGRRIVAVGTTTTRTLEHIAAVAERANHREHRETEGTQRVGAAVPMRVETHSGSTSIFLAPGHRFRIVSGLLTNFHLPESTLLMLVSAFAGREAVLAAYAHAIREGYNFYSYGDCMLIL